jgi:hypothetical protein
MVTTGTSIYMMSLFPLVFTRARQINAYKSGMTAFYYFTSMTAFS